MNIEEARKKWPMYSDLTDMQLADSIGRKYYPELSVDEVAGLLDVPQKAAPVENTSGFVESAKANIESNIAPVIKGVKEIYENTNLNPFSFKMSPMVGGGYGNEAPGYVPPPEVTGAWIGKSLPAEALKYATGKTDFAIEQKQLDFADNMVRVHEKSGDTESREYRGWLKMSSDIRGDRDVRENADISFDTFKKAFQDNPNIMVAELINVLWEDPYLMATPLGYEKAAAASIVRTAKYGATVSKVAGVAGGTAAAAVTGAAIVAPISVFEQLNENETVSMSRVAKETGIGAAFAGGVSMALGAPGTIASAGAKVFPDITNKVMNTTFRQGEKTLLLGDGNLPAPTPARIEPPKAGRVIDVDAGGNARIISNEDPAANALERSADRQMAQSAQEAKALPAPEGRDIIAPHERWGLEGRRLRESWGLDVEARAVTPAEGVEFAQARITNAEAQAAESKFSKTRVPSNLSERELAIRQAVSETLMEPEKAILARISKEDKAWLRNNFAGKNDSERLRTARKVYGKQGGKIDLNTAAWITLGAVGAGIGFTMSDGELTSAYKGALIAIGGYAAIRILPKIAKAARDSVKNAGDTRIRIDHLLDDYDHAIASSARRTFAFREHIKSTVPDSGRRVAMTHHSEDPNVKVTSVEGKVAAQIRNNLDAWHKLAKSEGVVEGFIENYMPHLWRKGPLSDSEIINALREQRRGVGKSPHTLHGKPRLIDSYAEGIALGFEPQTLDIADLVKLYGDAINRAITNKRLIATLSDVKGPNGENLVMPTDSAPKGFVHIEHPQMRGKLVHPDIAPSLKFAFEANDPGTLGRGVSAVNFAAKRMSVSLSFFHLNALLESALFAGTFGRAGTGVAVHAKNIATNLGPAAVGGAIGGAALGPPGALGGAIIGYLGKQVHNASQVINGTSKLADGRPWLEVLKLGGQGDVIDDALKAGLKIGSIEDVGTDVFYAAMKDTEAFLNKALPGAGTAFDKTFVGANQLVDHIMWDRFSTGVKLITFSKEMEIQVLRNARQHQANPAKYPLRPKEEIAKEVAEYVNDAFGGLNWRMIAEKTRTKMGRDIKLQLFSPGGRKDLQIAAFAPDWTAASARIAIKAIPGVASTKTIGAMHRKYMLRSLMYFATIANGVNYLMSGHFIWENEHHDADESDSPRQAAIKKIEAMSRIDVGDGRSMVWSKQFGEPFQWATDPFKTALNKAGIGPKYFTELLTNKEYLTTTGHSPPIWKEDENVLVEIAKHTAGKFTPITASQFEKQGPQGLAGFFGHPLYGQTDAERERRKEEGAEKRKANRKSTR